MKYVYIVISSENESFSPYKIDKVFKNINLAEKYLEKIEQLRKENINWYYDNRRIIEYELKS